MATFVLEIGSEELPSRFLAGEEAYLKQGFEAKLAESGLEFQSVSVYSTPRRAVVAVRGLALVQAEKEEEISGPPARVAWKDGQPTKALEGFARTNGVDVKDTYLVTTPKGEYVAVKTRTGGRPAADVLAEICPALVAGVPFAKRMHWGSYAYTYARPLQWVLALLDFAMIVWIMFSGARRLELRQDKNYGADPEYQKYVRTVPILIPFVPLYSVKKYKFLVA